MTPTLALIPAKRRSEGVPDKNWIPLEGLSCYHRALVTAEQTCDVVVTSSDADAGFLAARGVSGTLLRRPFSDGPMLDVVRHVLEQVQGPDDEIVVLLQPTSPLRTAATVRQAIQMLQDDTRATSVVSVSPSYPCQWSLKIDGDGCLECAAGRFSPLDNMPHRRQDCEPTYKRDGVVYAFVRKTLRDFGSIYGSHPLALFTPPEESLSIDTPEDWEEAVRRLNARQESDADLSTGNP